MTNRYRRADLHRRKSPANCIAIYRLEEGLTLPELSRILGSQSYQSTRSICASAHPSEKLVRILASHEALSVPEFLHRYSPFGKGAA